MIVIGCTLLFEKIDSKNGTRDFISTSYYINLKNLYFGLNLLYLMFLPFILFIGANVIYLIKYK